MLFAASLMRSNHRKVNYQEMIPFKSQVKGHFKTCITLNKYCQFFSLEEWGLAICQRARNNHQFKES